MYHTNDPLEQDILDLFEDDKIHVNAMRQFFIESVCDYLADDADQPKHEKASARFFDQWYRSTRKAIWASAAQYILEHQGTPHETAVKEANTAYRKAYWQSDKKRRKETSNEN